MMAARIRSVFDQKRNALQPACRKLLETESGASVAETMHNPPSVDDWEIRRYIESVRLAPRLAVAAKGTGFIGRIMDACITTKELAAELGIYPKTLDGWVHKGVIPRHCFIQVGHKRRFLPAAVACLNSTGQWPETPEEQAEWYLRLKKSEGQKAAPKKRSGKRK